MGENYDDNPVSNIHANRQNLKCRSRHKLLPQIAQITTDFGFV